MTYRIAFVVVLIACGPSLSAAARPNVLFIICDDLNRHVGFCGYANIQSPNLNELAADSLVFRRAYCQYPVCGPSRASMLSGLYPESTGVLDNKSDIRDLRGKTISMPRHFRNAGYWTARTGKVFHNESTNPRDAWDVSPPRFRNDELPIVRDARLEFLKTHDSINRKNRQAWKSQLQSLATQTRGQKRPGYGPSGLDDDQHKDGKNASQVMQWLRDQPFGDKPFFIACGIQKPHVPFLAPQKYFDLYPQASLTFELPPADDWATKPRLAMNKRFQGFGFELGVENDSLRREYTQAYHACVSFLDAQVGRVIRSLKQNGLYDQTIIVFTSDHGYHLGEHFMWGKVTLFEECARIPMTLRVPGTTTAGSSTDSLVELVDLFPTLARLASLPMPPDLQGADLTPVLRAPAAEVRDAVYTVVSRGKTLGRSLRTQRYRYAEWGSPHAAELYDLKTDPLEYVNLLDDPRMKSTRKRLSGMLRQLQEVATRQRQVKR